MWARLMDGLRYHEDHNKDRSADLMPEALHARIYDLEMHVPFFFAKLLRAHVLDHELYQTNTYEYAWVEVKPVSEPTDCCANCLTSRHDLCTEDCLPVLPCCSISGGADCLTYHNFQGHWNWWEHTLNTSWGDTLPITGFENTSLRSDFNPLQYTCIAGNADADNCDPDGTGGYPNINTVAYTKPAMNILEAFNTADDAAGVDQSGGIGDFMMQAVGGGDTITHGNQATGETFWGAEDSYTGDAATSIPECWDDELSPPEPPCTQYEFPLRTTPIVLMFNIRESKGTFRQVFQAVNSYDGTCVAC